MTLPPSNVPSGFQLLHSIPKGISSPNEAAWSPDGRLLAIPEGQAIHLWDHRAGKPVAALGQIASPENVAWSPAGGELASTHPEGVVAIWDVQRGRLRSRWVNGHGAFGLAWSPDGTRVAVGSGHGSVTVWDAATGEQVSTFSLGTGRPLSLAWLSNEALAASWPNGWLTTWSALDAGMIDVVGPRSEFVISYFSAMRAGGELRLAAVCNKEVIGIFEGPPWRHTVSLEGHTGPVVGLSFSSDGQLLASKAKDGTVRIWRCDTWEQLATLKESVRGPGGLQFHPELPILVTHSGPAPAVRIWSLDPEALSRAAPAQSEHYRNAKVVLVGDTGVGKSGLGLVLTHKPFHATESTHGREVWDLHTQEVALDGRAKETREVLLWDLAGQPGYRLIHQLHLHDVAVALIVFDSRNELDPFAGVRHWDRALRQAQRVGGARMHKLKKFLVAARVDRGRLSASPERINAVAAELGFDGYFQTSAKEGKEINELRSAILMSIAWEGLPAVTSNTLFRTIRLFLEREQAEGRVLSTTDDLYRSFRALHPLPQPPEDLRASFETCIKLLEAQGLLRRFSFGEQVLLKPELLDAYASALIEAAKTEPDGLGSIDKEGAMGGVFKMPSEGRLQNRNQEQLLLIAVVRVLFEHELVIEEPTEAGARLIFPSQFTREWPDAPELSGGAVIFRFEGALANIYATLAVRLSHSPMFTRREMWRNAAAFTASAGGQCSLRLRELQEGLGELTVYFDDQATEAARRQFEDYVAAHLERRANTGTVRRRRVLWCPECKTPFSKSQVDARRKLGHTSILCSVCETRVPLGPEEDHITISGSDAIQVIDQAADTRRDDSMAAMTIEGKIAMGIFDVFLSYNPNDLAAVRQLRQELLGKGIRAWLDKDDLRPGTPSQQAVEEQILAVKSAAVVVGPSGIGPWQDLERDALQRQMVERGIPVIPVILRGCTRTPELPAFLKGLHWVDFRELFPDPMEQLLYGITGQR